MRTGLRKRDRARRSDLRAILEREGRAGLLPAEARERWVRGQVALVFPSLSLLHDFRLAAVPWPARHPRLQLLFTALLDVRPRGARTSRIESADRGGGEGLSNPRGTRWLSRTGLTCRIK